MFNDSFFGMQPDNQRDRGRARGDQTALNFPDPLLMMNESFAQMDKLMNQMFQPTKSFQENMHQFRDMENAPKNGMCFQSYSSQTSSWQKGQNQPTVYRKAITETRLPGQVAERQRIEYDSRTGNETVEISRRIGSRGRHVVKEKRGGNLEEITEDRFHGMNKADAPLFDNEWNKITGNNPQMLGYRSMPRPREQMRISNEKNSPRKRRLDNRYSSHRGGVTKSTSRSSSSKMSNLTSRELLDKIHGTSRPGTGVTPGKQTSRPATGATSTRAHKASTKKDTSKHEARATSTRANKASNKKDTPKHEPRSHRSKKTIIHDID